MEIRTPLRSEVQELRRTRLRALADAPLALGEFLAEEEAFPLSYWESIADFSEAADERVAFVAVQDASFVGMVGGDFRHADSGVASLVALWVEPAARGKGVGRRLVQAVVDWAQQRGADRVELWVVNSNDAAQALYRRTGFMPAHLVQPVPWAPSFSESLLTRPSNPGQPARSPRRGNAAVRADATSRRIE
jgi:ribosomal protein S18 acetylase RimI-like enzyme